MKTESPQHLGKIPEQCLLPYGQRLKNVIINSLS